MLLGVLFGCAQMVYNGFKQPFGACVDSAFLAAHARAAPTRECTDLLTYGGIVIVAFLGIEIMVAFLVYIVMNKGFLLPKNAFKFKLESLNFMANFKNLFKKENLTSFITSTIKEILLYGLFAMVFLKYFEPLIYAAQCGTNCSSNISEKFIWVLFLTLLPIGVVFAMIDYPLRVYFHRVSMRMSHKEVKDEHKETEGSPEVKQHRNEFKWEIMNGLPTGPRSATFFVRTADKIIGIRYRPEESPAPMIVAVGQTNEPTQRMASLGFNMRRLVVWDDQFAKALSKQAAPGRPVPLTFIREIRTCLAQLRQHEEKTGPTHRGEKAKY